MIEVTPDEDVGFLASFRLNAKQVRMYERGCFSNQTCVIWGSLRAGTAKQPSAGSVAASKQRSAAWTLFIARQNARNWFAAEDQAMIPVLSQPLNPAPTCVILIDDN